MLTGVISYLSNQSLKRTVRQGLLAISDAKTTQLETYIRERRADLNVASRYPALVDAIPKLKQIRRKESLDSPAYLELARSVRPFMANFVDSFGYANAYLFDTDGTVLFRLKADLDLGSNLLNGPLKDSELAEVFDRVRTLLQIEVSDYQMYPGRSEPAAFIASPIFNAQGRIIGFVALELGNQQVFRVFNDYSGLGETGETMVVMRSRRGDSRSSLRHVTSPTRPSSTGCGSAATRRPPCRRPCQGQRGYGEAIDYRGKPVIAAWSYLPSYRWGMVVKQDVDEAFALIYQQRWVVALLLAATVVIVTAVALWLARTITRPIREAASVTERVAAGDLTVTCEGQAPGEAGTLLQAIRKMIQDLRSLIGKIQRSSITLLSTATEIAATSRQQEQAVYDYSASTNEAAAAVNEISATSQELLKTMNEVNQVANQTARMASTGQQSLAGMDQTMRQARRVDRLDRLEAVGHQRARRQHQPGRDHHHQGRRPDQPAVDQRGDRGREGRRVRPGLPGRRPRDPPPGRPDRRRHPRHRAHGQGDAVQRLGRRDGDGQVQRAGPQGRRRGRPDRRPARPDHQRRPGPAAIASTRSPRACASSRRAPTRSARP